MQIGEIDRTTRDRSEDVRPRDIPSWTFEERLEEVLKRALPKLGPEARRQVEAIMTKETLKIICAVLVLWVVGHFFGVSQIVDTILISVGVIAVGVAVFSGVDHLYEFASGTYHAKTEQDLDVAAEHFAKAVNILGITAVLAVIMKNLPRTKGLSRQDVGPMPPKTPGWRFKPQVSGNPKWAAGYGETSAWGVVEVSTRGSKTDQQLVLLHEKVHRFLAPKLYLFRQYRVQQRFGGYFGSSFHRYIEEALAETIARVGVEGMRKFFVGIKFPVKEGYVHIVKKGGWSEHFTGNGLIPEGAALIAIGIVVQGEVFEMWHTYRDGG